MSSRNSQLKFNVDRGTPSSDDYGGYISDSVLETRKHHKNQKPHVTFSDNNNNEVPDVHKTSKHRHAHFYTNDINDEAEEFIRLKHNQMSIDL
ncbi:hypothetical protein E5676_scaffold35G001490 [Cucumis melo var. makuwa]|nr:hypothetical protein E6C27_scaffold65G002670 [Cucumis melo var. makuwa]TYK15652.1 hypothetical protein E5676_scaffold35G001490 [Cucumis melo var. makuwa]